MHRPPAPALLLLLALALMPFGRGVEWPFMLLALFGAAITLSGRLFRSGADWQAAALLYLAFALPMLLALPDAVNRDKSLYTLIGSIRFIAFTAGLLYLLHSQPQPGPAQRATLRFLGLGAAVLLLAWNADGLLQFFTGRDVLGYGIRDGYINGPFGDGDNLKFGITLALLLPVALVQVLRSWPPAAAWGFLALSLLLLTLSGKRAAWIATIVELSLIGIYYWHRGRVSLRRLPLLGALLLSTVALGYGYSDWVQKRSDVLLVAAEQRDYATLNEATGYRLPIWTAASAMARDNWLNGVGPRGFRFAYSDYALPDDTRWTRRLSSGGAKASHAHQLLLEVAAETGVPGLLGLVLLWVLLLRAWHVASAAARSRALPFAVSLAGMMFPLNTHAAWYSSWSGVMLWLFIGLYLYALAEVPEEPA